MINLGLSRISSLLTYLPTPQSWQAIHIAGTNGKGSVASYISSLLRRHCVPRSSDTSVKIGKFTSPHLIDRWDCITINDDPVSQSTFLRVEAEVRLLAGKVFEQQSAEGPVTEFELLTATAFEIFSQTRCQVAVIECGLGGRLDATNALDPNKVAVSVITKVGLDHQGLLGDSVEDIAREKAGIAKQGVPFVVDGSNGDGVKQAIREQSTKLLSGELLESTGTEGGLSLPRHQLENLQVAILAYKTAAARLPSLTCSPVEITDTKAIATLLSDVQRSYPGRLQMISVSSIVPEHSGAVLLDGAHNPQSAIVLREYCDNLPQKDRIWILAMSRGKDMNQIMSILLRAGDRVISCPFGSVDGMPWVHCMDPDELATAAKQFTPIVETARNVVVALKLATKWATPGQSQIMVAGSLYLVSDLLRSIRDGNNTIQQEIDCARR